MEKRKDALVVRLSAGTKPEVQDNSWLPKESPVSSEIKPLESNETSPETQLKFCFVDGRYFLAQGKQWIAIEKEGSLKINQGFISLELEEIDPNTLPKKMQSSIPVWRRSKAMNNPLDIRSNLAKGDPLDFLEVNRVHLLESEQE